MPRKVKRKHVERKTKKVAKKNKGKGSRYFNVFNSKVVRNRKPSPDLEAEDIEILRNNLEKKTNKKLQMVLDIPLVVIAQVVSNIKEIENLAEKENIPLKRAQSFLKEETVSGNSLRNGWVVPRLKHPPAKTLDFIPLNSKCKNTKIYDDSLLATSQPTPVDSKVEWLDFLSLKPETKRENNNAFTTLKPAPLGTGIKKPPIENPDFISFNKKAPSKFHQAPKYEKNLEPAEQPSPSTSRPCTSQGHKTEPLDEIIYVPKKRLPKYENKNIKTNCIPVKSESTEELKEKLFLRSGSLYKYGYKDITTGTFDEKLDENLAEAVSVCTKSQGNDCLSVALLEEFRDMITRTQFKDMMVFREQLPAFNKSEKILDVINNNQVVVISGETGCGKSTQVPQIILDNAICQNKGAYIHILVTQPRRIAASSLASRVAQERAERLGNSVGYAVRLEKTECRPTGSIKYVTTGILLAELEVNQGLTSYSHIILDEAHERDSHLDLSMCMLKKVLKKRRDLKLILMSATIDSRRLCTYFDDCPMLHIEGLAYPVQDYYLEDVLTMTGYRLPPIGPVHSEPQQDDDWDEEPGKMNFTPQKKDLQYQREIGPWLRSFKGRLEPEVCSTLQDRRIEKLNIYLIMSLLVHISRGPPGAVLVFLPGIGDIFRLIRTMNESEAFPSSMYQIYPLHSKLSTIDQHRIFKRPPRNIRKIIIATNIAETSITIDDIVYVVDSGRVKMKGLDVERNISTLKTEFESKANLRQRRGRAGRCQPGIAYHLMTSYRSQNIPDRLLPELQRSNLLEPVLQIKKLRLGRAQDAFKLVPDPPSEITIEKAVRHLQQCGALDDSEQLTPLGWHLARLPLHPMAGKLLLLGALFGCVERAAAVAAVWGFKDPFNLVIALVLVSYQNIHSLPMHPAAGKLLLLGALFGCVERAAAVAAVWGFKDPFNLVIGKEQEINKAKRLLALGEPSDHVAVSEAIIQWEQLDPGQQSRFAYDHFLSENTLGLLCQMKKQLCDNLRQMGFLASKNVRVSWENRNAGNLCIFKAIMAAALYPNVGIVRWTNLENTLKQQKIIVSTPEDGRVQLHPSSIMFVNSRPGPRVQLCDKPGANWLVYWMKQKSSSLFLFEVTLVFTLPLLLFGELEVGEVENSPEECYLSVSTVKVRCLKGTADVIFRLRTLLDQVLASMVKESSDRSTRYSEFDNLVFKAVIDLMTLEDERPDGLEDEDTDSNSDCEIVSEITPRGDIIIID